MDLIAFGVLLPWLVVGMGCWLGYQLVRQNGRLLLRLEALEQALAQLQLALGSVPAAAAGASQGLPVGSPAPEFELPDLTGQRRALADFRGKRLLLIFFNPRCGYCLRMAPDLAALPLDGADGRPLPLVVSAGEPEENRQLVEAHDIRCPLLLQEETELLSRYQVDGTPMGYLVDAEGRIESPIAAGADALLALADRSAPGAGSANGRHRHRGNRPLAESKIARNGLAAGTPAPGFTLPTPEGAEISLEAYRGRRVLLLFSDPNCGPCQYVMPQLEQFHRQRPQVAVLVVSRGEAEANRAKAQEQGLTFPIVLQKQWEISRAYGMFATPIAYLIDEEGIIAADVAVGVEAIQALLARAAAPTNGREKEAPGRQKAAARQP